MFSWLSNAWRVPELRRRVLFTALILAIYRLGSWIPAPGVDPDAVKDYFNDQGGTVLGLLNLFSASARKKIEQAGGSITWIRGEPAAKPPKRRERKAAPPPEEPGAEEQTAEAEEVEEPPTPEPPPEGDDET